MSRRKIKIRKHADPKRPNLHFLVNYREAGKRRRRYFETKGAANAFASFKNSELKQNGIEHAEFPSVLRVMAQSASQRLEPFGRTITDAVDHFVAHLEATEKSITVTEFVPQLLSAKEGDCLSKRYIQDLSEKLFRFAGSFGGKIVASITAKEIDAWLRSLPVGPTTRNNFRRVLVTFFSDAISLGYATSNPAAVTAKAKEVDSPPGILTV